MVMYIVTASRLSDSTVVYFTATHTWSRWIADAQVCQTKDSADQVLTEAGAHTEGADVTEPYLIDVYREAQTIKPMRYREVIRARGPVCGPVINPAMDTASDYSLPLPLSSDGGSAVSVSGAFLNGL